MLEAKNIHKAIGKNKILRGVNLQIKAGESVAIMGPSGSGKSTLLYCLAGIYQIDSGEVTYEDIKISSLNSNKLADLRKNTFGFVFQNSELVPELPVRDNIALPLLLRGDGKKKSYDTADKIIKILGIEGIVKSLPGTLSGGEAQRVAIARAVSISPQVIFADEPTGSLDSNNSKKAMALLTTVSKKLNATLIIVTHSRQIASHADRIIKISDGQITNE